MSLQVWLPLNGDLHNQGLSKISVTNNGATINDNGKIGKCYSFDGSDDFISLNSQKLYDIFQGGTQQFSIAFWVYHADATRAIIFGDYGLTGSISFNIELTTSHAVRFYWAGSPDKNFNSTSYVAASAWTHICLTYDGSKVQIYRNGILSTDIYNGTLAVKNKTSGMFYLGRDSRTGTTALNGKLNDFRIYDHALSAREVKELSKGLVLHYQLNDSAVESTTNLITSISPGGQTTVTNNIVTTSGTNGDTYFTLNLSEDITVGTQYTLSCWTDFPDNTSWNFPIGAQSNSSLAWLLKPGYNEYTFTANNISWGTKRVFMDDISGTARTSGIPCKFYNFQLEKKDHATRFAGYGKIRTSTIIYDSSGYGNNGEIIGALTIIAPSIQYNCTTKFDGNTACIKIPYNNINPDRIFTVNLWFYKDALGFKNYETLFGGPSGFEMDTRAGSASTLSLYMASTRGGNVYSPLSLNEWTMITMVRDGTNELYYVNGDLKKTIEAKSMPSGQYRIGAWASDTGQNYYGNISDFRIYATALSADDIKELYRISKIVNGTTVTARDLEVSA